MRSRSCRKTQTSTARACLGGREGVDKVLGLVVSGFDVLCSVARVCHTSRSRTAAPEVWVGEGRPSGVGVEGFSHFWL